MNTVVFGKDCVATCPNGYYTDAAGCIKCGDKCNSCTSGECTQCEADFYKSGK